ncbi:WD repeat-containing protein 88 [Pelodytes ibericus]
METLDASWRRMALEPLAVKGESPGPERKAPCEEEQPVWENERLSQVPFRVLRGHTGAVSSCHFCFEDSKIISCSHDNTARLWDVSSSKLIHVFTDEHTGPVSECHITSDNKRLITSSYDKTVRSWDLETGKVLGSIGFELLVTSCNVSPDGKHIVCSLDVDNAVCIIDSATSSRIACLNDHHAGTVTRCCFDSEGQRVCSVSTDGAIKLWDLAAQRTTIKINRAHSNVISDCSFTSNSRLLCTASWDKSLKLWDINTGEFRLRGPDVLRGVHKGCISACQFSKDASMLVSVGYDKTAVLWDVDAACKKLVLKGHEDWVLDVAISANKDWILSASKDSTLRLWNIQHYEQIPAVIENKKVMGPRVAQCEDCDKPFPRMHWDDSKLTTCVFCRLASPYKNALPLPPVPNPLP